MPGAQFFCLKSQFVVSLFFPLPFIIAIVFSPS